MNAPNALTSFWLDLVAPLRDGLLGFGEVGLRAVRVF